MTTRPAHYRRNFVVILGDYVGFALGMAFASRTTVLPEFASQLTDSKVVIGLLTTAADGSWLLPQLIFANWLTGKRRKKPYIILGAVVGRPFYLLYAVALGMGLHRQPALALALLFVVQILFFSTDALAAVAWFDVLGKAIPERRRGRLFGSAQLISGVMSIGAGVFITALLSETGPPFPNNYAIILGIAGGWFMFSLFSCGLIVEPDDLVETERAAWRDYLPQLVKTLREDHAFARLVLVRLLGGFDGLALGFYILFATQKMGLPSATAGIFIAAQTAGSIIASVGLGTLAERSGGQRVIQVATGVGVTAPLVALALIFFDPLSDVFTIVVLSWVFGVIGLMVNASMLGHFNYVLELAPPGQRPTYIGLFNTISGVLIVLPAIGGWLLQATSYGVLFGLTAVLMLLAHRLSFGLPAARRDGPSAPLEVTA